MNGVERITTSTSIKMLLGDVGWSWTFDGQAACFIRHQAICLRPCGICVECSMEKAAGWHLRLLELRLLAIENLGLI